MAYIVKTSSGNIVEPRYPRAVDIAENLRTRHVLENLDGFVAVQDDETVYWAWTSAQGFLALPHKPETGAQVGELLSIQARSALPYAVVAIADRAYIDMAPDFDDAMRDAMRIAALCNDAEVVLATSAPSSDFGFKASVVYAPDARIAISTRSVHITLQDYRHYRVLWWNGELFIEYSDAEQ